MQAGDKINVYQRPMTDEDFEGVAILVRPVDGNPEPDDRPDVDQFWVVQFIDSRGGVERDTYNRFVYPRHLAK